MRPSFFLQVIVVAAALSMGSSSAYAGGERLGVGGVGMARTFVASARGLEAIGTNPANLALGDRGHTVTFTLIPPFAISLGSDFWNYEIYNDYFTGVDTGGTERASKHLTNSDKERILSLFPDGLAETHFDLDIRWFGMTVHAGEFGSVGLSVAERLAFNFDLPQEYARFALMGLDSAGSSYDLSGTDVRAWWLREYSLSYARMLPNLVFARKLAAGVSLKLIHGFGYVETDRYNVRFSNSRYTDALGSGYRLEGDIDFRFRRAGIDAFEDDNSASPFPSPAGTGFGFDLGVSGELLPGIRAALSLVDVGSITWTLNTKETIGGGRISITNPTSKAEQDTLEEAIKGEDRATGEFSTPLATALRVGGSLQLGETPWLPSFPGQLLVAVEYHQGFNSSPGNSTRPRFSLGVEYRLVGFLPLRSGISIGGADRFNWAFGFGLDFGGFALDLGTENVLMLFTPSSFDQFSAGMAMRVRI